MSIILRLLTDRQGVLSAVTATNISQSFYLQDGGKINRHAYGTKLRHCHPMYKIRLSHVRTLRNPYPHDYNVNGGGHLSQAMRRNERVEMRR